VTLRPTVFISHASEDKDEVARPLAQELRDRGFTVWYDEYVLKVGDSLLVSIDSGLRDSDYGIVILSPHFFAKKWPQRELAGLIAREAGDSLILPVWHRITASDIAKYSPILADKLAASTSTGISDVVNRIVKAMRRRSVGGDDLQGNEYCIPYVISGANVYKRLLDTFGHHPRGDDRPPDFGIKLCLYADASGIDDDHSFVRYPNGVKRQLVSRDVLAVLNREPYVPRGYGVRRWSVSDELPMRLPGAGGPDEESAIDIRQVDEIHFTAVLEQEFISDEELIIALRALVTFEDGLPYHQQGELWQDREAPGRVLVRRVIRTGRVRNIEDMLEVDWDFSWTELRPVSDYRVFCLARALVEELSSDQLMGKPELVSRLLGARSPLNDYWKRRLLSTLEGRPYWVDQQEIRAFLSRRGLEFDSFGNVRPVLSDSPASGADSDGTAGQSD
ncbi:MAG: toll/interleukin-1 receptor domain-containing protein, partial [Micromonospora sp.]